MNTGYQVLIGLEIHVALDTESKLFCSCGTEFARPPNSQVCPVCLALPGSLPVLNRRAVELGTMAALALGAEVYPTMRFERKNYHYPDLPKGYQISQLAAPLAESGSMTYVGDDEEDVTVRIRRVHLEEDAGKSVHVPGDGTLLDFNRCGVPLAEVVTEPDLHSPGDTRAFLEHLRELLRSVGVSQVRMEEGELRCDVNVNLADSSGGSPAVTEISEIKNLSSFRGVERALRYEVRRHQEAAARGERLTHETRHWDEDREITRSARTKEEAHDYRYFPDPDLLEVALDPAWVKELESRMPETPTMRRKRLQREFRLDSYDADVLVGRGLAGFFEAGVEEGGDPKALANWIMGDVLAYLNAHGKDVEDLPMDPVDLVQLLRMVDEGTVSGRIAKDVLLVMAEEGGHPADIVQERGLIQISDEAQLVEIAAEVLAENPGVAEDFLGGKEKALGYLVGQIMKKTRGKANPQLAHEKLRELLQERGET